MSMAAALKLARAVDLTRHVLAIEILARLSGAGPARAAHDVGAARARARVVRAAVPPLTVDRSPSPDIARIAELIERGELARATGLGLAYSDQVRSSKYEVRSLLNTTARVSLRTSELRTSRFELDPALLTTYPTAIHTTVPNTTYHVHASGVNSFTRIMVTSEIAIPASTPA